MATEDHADADRYELVVDRETTYSLRRGGRFGLTVETSSRPQHGRDHAFMIFVGALLALHGVVYLSGIPAAFSIGAGSFLAGVAGERWHILSSSDREEVSSDE